MKKREMLILVVLILFISMLTLDISAISVKSNLSNKKVTGDSVSGKLTQAVVSLNITVTGKNNPPFLGHISTEILTCEGNSLEYYFNATDPDGYYELVLSLSPTYPLSPFYLTRASVLNSTTASYLLYSGILNKYNAGGANFGSKTYLESIYVHDGYFSNSTSTNITVIEINNPPSINPIGVQTVEVWTHGENSTFYKQIIATDVESGDQNSGNLSFDITFINSSLDSVNLFNISYNGWINFTPTFDMIGVYNVTVFVTDQALLNPHQNISICPQDGSNITSNISFSLTVTDVNRPPYIEHFEPYNLSLSPDGTERLFFNISTKDPDGTIPDAYWYVDGILMEYDSGSSFDEFNHSFGCGVLGNHEVKAEITDGLLNDSVTWNLSVGYIECPSPEGGGGGGGVSKPVMKEGCTSNWACGEWNQCINLEESYNFGSIGIDQRLFIRGLCYLFSWDDSICGFQTRDCKDLNNCIEEQESITLIPPQKPIEAEVNRTENISQKAPEEIPPYEESMPEPSKKPGEEGCASDYICSDWSACKSIYGLGDISKNEFNLKGEQFRECIDVNKCNYDKTEKRYCPTKTLIVAKGVGGYIEVYDKKEEILVSRLRKSGGQLNIQIPLDGLDYTPRCYDGIKNQGEDEVDCSYSPDGVCLPCAQEMSSFRGDYILMWITFILLLSSCLFLGFWYFDLGMKIHKNKSKKLSLRQRNLAGSIKKPARKSGSKEFLYIFALFGAALILLIFFGYSFTFTGKVIFGNDSSADIPETIRECYYTKEPNCNDGIKNCHGGSCEVITDCGGPCKPCPTCSDGIQNQEETGIDCGGSCPACFTMSPAITSAKPFLYISLIITILISILIARLIFKNYEIKKKFEHILKTKENSPVVKKP